MSDIHVTSHGQIGGVTAGVIGGENPRVTARVFTQAEFKLLDHGHLKYVEAWGSDEMIVQAARTSTQRSFVSWNPYSRCDICDAVWLHPECPSHRDCNYMFIDPCHVNGGHAWKDFPRGDLGILSYLWKNKHSTPFEMAGLTLDVQAPIFVFREWHRHRVPFGYSEASARYAPLPALDYLPPVERLMRGGGHLTKQAASADGAKVLNEAAAQAWLLQLEDLYQHAQLVYQTGLNVGVPKELARCSLTVSRFTRMFATGNLRGWLGFRALRFTEHAQEEIRVYAQAIDSLMRQCFPRTMQVVEENGG